MACLSWSAPREHLLMSRILVVGGAGYIGSHMVKALAQASRAKAELSWSPRRNRLGQIVGDA